MADPATADMARAAGLAGQAWAASPLTPLAHYLYDETMQIYREYTPTAARKMIQDSRGSRE